MISKINFKSRLNKKSLNNKILSMLKNKIHKKFHNRFYTGSKINPSLNTTVNSKNKVKNILLIKKVKLNNFNGLKV